MLQKDGKVTDVLDGVFELVRTYFEKPATLLIGLRNTSEQEATLTLDCSESNNLFCSKESFTVTKTIAAGELAWMMNCEAEITCQEFTLASSVSWPE